MLSTVTVPQDAYYIHDILPNVKIYYKLNNLLMDISTTNIQEQHLIAIAIEYTSQKRQFLRLSFEKLSNLLNRLEPPKRMLYEIFCQNSFCKLYFDVDVYVDNSSEINIEESLSVLQNLFHYIISNLTNQCTNNLTCCADHFLVLCVSTAKKHSYHLIYTNTLIRFQSQETISTFIISILHYCSYFIQSHTCHQHILQSININHKDSLNNCHIHLQTILSRTNSCECTIPATNVTCNKFQKLLHKRLF